MPLIQDIHVCIMLEAAVKSNGKSPALCMAITDYWLSSNKINSQQQPTAGYRQSSKSLPDGVLPTRMKTTRHNIIQVTIPAC